MLAWKAGLVGTNLALGALAYCEIAMITVLWCKATRLCGAIGRQTQSTECQHLARRSASRCLWRCHLWAGFWVGVVLFGVLCGMEPAAQKCVNWTALGAPRRAVRAAGARPNCIQYKWCPSHSTGPRNPGLNLLLTIHSTSRWHLIQPPTYLEYSGQHSTWRRHRCCVVATNQPTRPGTVHAHPARPSPFNQLAHPRPLPPNLLMRIRVPQSSR